MRERQLLLGLLCSGMKMRVYLKGMMMVEKEMVEKNPNEETDNDINLCQMFRFCFLYSFHW